LPIVTLAQTPPAPANSSIKVTTRLVVLSVVVTDRKGKPVTNLSKDDFTILENNQQQSINTFEPPPAIAPGAGDLNEPAHSVSSGAVALGSGPP